MLSEYYRKLCTKSDLTTPLSPLSPDLQGRFSLALLGQVPSSKPITSVKGQGYGLISTILSMEAE